MSDKAPAPTSNEALIRALDSISDAFFTLDHEFRFTYLNRVASEYFGMLTDCLLGCVIWDALPDKLGTIFENEIRRAANKNTPVRFEINSLINPGRCLSIRAYPSSDGLAVYSLDVTEQRRAEQSRKESEALFRAFITTTSDVMYRLSRDGTTLLHMDGHGLLRDTAEPSDRWVETYLPAHERQRVLDALATALQHGSHIDLDHQAIRADGSIAWLHSRAVPIRDPHGEIREWFGAARDITSRKTTEENLVRLTAESEQRKRLYEGLLSSTPDLAYVFDLNHRFIYANDVLLRMWGRTWDEAIGKNCLELGYEPWHAEMHDREIEQVRATKAPVRGEVPFTGTFGRRVYDYIFVPVLGPNGEVEAVAGTTRDVTERKEHEERLRLSEERAAEALRRLDGALIAGEIGTFEWDTLNQRVWGDQNFGRMFGVKLDADGKADLSDYIAVIHPDDRERMKAKVARTVDTGADYEIEYRVVQGNRIRWLLVRAKPERDQSGRVARAPGVCLDITEQKRVENALRESEERLRFVMDSIPQKIFTATASGEVDYFNPAWSEFTGLSFEQIRSWAWLQFIHPDDIEENIRVWKHAITTGEPFQFEHRFRRKDGTYRWHLSRALAMRDTRGQIAMWIGSNTDIHDVKTVEEALRHRERELETLANNTPDILTRFDRNLRHVFVNSAVERATGIKKEAFLGKTNRELGMPDNLCVQSEAAIRHVFEHGEPKSVHFEFESSDGVRYWTARFVPEFALDGSVEYALGVTQDQTGEKVAADALAEANRRKDEFLAILAHELRNPLAPIRNGLQILRLAPTDSQTAARAREMMDRQLSHMVRLIDDLLDVSRISRGKVKLQKEVVTVRSVIESAIEGSLPLINAGHHTLSVHVPEGELLIDADPTRAAQIVSNLLNNAAKYTPDGGHITVSVERNDTNVLIRVIDSGIGISREMIPMIFELFTQAGTSHHHGQGGLGIGLALVKRLVEMHGWSIDVESDGAGKGSTFTIGAPLVIANEVGLTSVEDHLPPTSSLERSRKILVVDDNVDGATSLSLALELTGNETRVAHSGPEALGMLNEFHPDVILCDIGMPGMNGYEVAQQVRQHPTLKSTRLVAVTGWGSEEDKRSAKAAGFDLHLTKPVQIAEVEGVLAGLGSSLAS